MEPSDNELRRELAGGPLKHGGFNDKLQQQIMRKASGEQQDGGAKRIRRFWSWAGGAVAAFVLAATVVANVVPAPLRDGPSGGAGMAADRQASNADSGADEEDIFSSALLIGLRADHDGTEETEISGSSYRTVLVAPEAGRPEMLAEGEGILLPYGQEFWKIEPVKGEAQGVPVTLLTAYPAAKGGLLWGDSADNKQPRGDLYNAEGEKTAGEPVLVEEKLTFAANRYISVEQTVASPAFEGEMHFVWMKEAGMLAGTRELAFDYETEPRVLLEEVWPDQEQAIQAKDSLVNGFYTSYFGGWTVARQEGRWVGMQALNDSLSSQFGQYELQELEGTVPESVVSYDRLPLAWDEIAGRVPGAKDAFASSSEDMVAVVTDRELLFYGYSEEGLSAHPYLELSIGGNESVVMMQWASAPLYVERWMTEGKELLEN